MDCSPPASSVLGILQVRCWSVLPCPPPGHPPNPGIAPSSPALQENLPLEQGRPVWIEVPINIVRRCTLVGLSYPVSSVFKRFFMMFLGMDFFAFILFGIHSASRIYRLTPFARLEKLSAIVSLNLLSASIFCPLFLKLQ